MIYDLCIVGAGMFGSAAARHASANPALKVCLVGPKEPKIDELKDREIFGCHYDEGRITRIVDDDPACQILSRNSISRYRELEKLSGIKFYQPVGCLFLCQNNGTFMEKVLQATDGNVSITDLSCKETFQKRYPYLFLQKDEIGLLDDNGAGHISPRSMVEAQKKVAKMQGCDVLEQIVSEVILQENGIYQIDTKNPSARDNKKSSIQAKRVLIATGSFINTKMFSALKALRVTKYKRTVALLKISKDEAKNLSSMPSIIYRRENRNSSSQDKSAYILPPIKYPDGSYYLKIGYYARDIEAKTLEDIAQWYLSKGDEEVVKQGLKLLTEIIPGLVYESISSDTCINCYTPTGLPYIDRVTPTLTVAIAGNGKGAKFSDEVGRLAAQLCATGNWDSELSKKRFSAIFSNEDM